MQEEIDGKSSHSCLCCADASHPSQLCQGLAVCRLPTEGSLVHGTILGGNIRITSWYFSCLVEEGVVSVQDEDSRRLSLLVP